MSQGQPCPSSVNTPVLPSLGLTILEVACNMELPHGGEGWQQLRQGYLPPEFTAGKWRVSMERSMLPQGGQACVGGNGWQWWTAGLTVQSPLTWPCPVDRPVF